MRNFVHPNQPPVLIRYGKFIQTIIYLFIVALVLFFLVKFVNKLHRIAVKNKAEQPNIELHQSNEELNVLKEIRDLLAGRPVVQHEL
jgi:large conductance mechanosensitive channel